VDGHHHTPSTVPPVKTQYPLYRRLTTLPYQNYNTLPVHQIKLHYMNCRVTPVKVSAPCTILMCSSVDLVEGSVRSSTVVNHHSSIKLRFASSGFWFCCVPTSFIRTLVQLNRSGWCGCNGLERYHVSQPGSRRTSLGVPREIVE
jgi:hypothetical protein